ncbi:MAG: WD40-like beta Propeller containing protein [Gemmatimonadetes bacterium]|jgi:dipeptidyl aminopeptidase/acylaminoacyl peptidase|nr:WD40-like beta Propeller containing protein [Gemmatimonadota bacterium]
MTRTLLLLVAATFATLDAGAQAPARRALRAGDLYQLKNVGDPQLSPDGNWVAHTVTTPDSAKDKSDSDVWMSSWDGTASLRVTSSPESESSPRFSPDGRWLAFVSGRQEGKGGQVWLLDRRGGEAQRLTTIKGGISDYVWSPDSRRLVLVLEGETDSLARRDTAERKTPRPIVVDRYNFKQDVAGYLGTKRTHLALFDVAARKLDTLTSDRFDDELPSWSPDGQRIAFVRERLAEPGKAGNADIHVIEARPRAVPRALTDFDGPDGGRPAWSPDGRTIAFVRGDEPKYSAYHLNKLAVVPADGSAPARVVTAALDRPVSSPHFTADGRAVLATISDDRAEPLVRIRLADGAVDRVVGGRSVVQGYAAIPGGRTAVLLSTPDRAPELFAVEGSAGPRRISHHNDSLFAQLDLVPAEDFTSRSADGTEVHSLLFRPLRAPAGGRVPTLLYIHGGPNSQDSYRFDFDRQFFAANGYAVLAVNYRGSSGRGAAFQRAIFADWGNKEVVDLVGAVDEAVKQGIADPQRLGIGGWSYGGILTDYTIATTGRFKAAVSGAGSALQLSMYGSDQYVHQYDLEIGVPWKAQDAWIRISYPFFHADRITTPTLFMGGQNDYNVPIIGSEQMYQALRTLGVETALVIYPNQFHGITVPSYRKDRLERYLSWYDRFLRTTSSAARP